MSVARYRKKPVVIEAVQFTGDNTVLVAGWCNGKPILSAREILIQTLEGVMTAVVGDWIIKGVQGEFYPCKDSVFRATYDPVEPAG